MISSTDFFNKIGQKLTHAPQQNNAHVGKRLALRSSHRRIFGLTKVCLPWPNQSPLRCIQTTSFILQTEHNEFATNSVRSWSVANNPIGKRIRPSGIGIGRRIGWG